MPKPKSPKVLFLFLADSHRQGENRKFDAFGIFNRFYVWASPATRDFSLAFGLSNLTKGETSFEVLVRNPDGREFRLAEFSASANDSSEDAQLETQSAIKLRIALHHTGLYHIGLGPKGYSRRTILWIPFNVTMREWPELPTGKVLQAILDDPHSLKTARVGLICESCKRQYKFELSINPHHAYPRGTKPFPGNGVFKCPACKTVHQLKDLEGQLITRLSNQGAPEEGK